MKKRVPRRALAVIMCGLATMMIAADPFMDLVKIIGVGAAVTSYAPKLNDAINKLANQHDTPTMTTKVVPILTGGINSRKAIGAAQVMGPR
ncbi:MAG TPA: hypothetical protein VMI31_01325, partial [Fimbriimonadaceae bacterium]|nr:hypothetical protein [Fimbriimonadaceae bacterium]